MDGEIKAPPSAGVHVVGWIFLSAPAQALLAHSSERPMVSLVAAPPKWQDIDYPLVPAMG